MEVLIIYPIYIIERKASAQADDSPNVAGIEAEVCHEFLNISPVSRHRAAREPKPQGFVGGDALHLERQELALRLVDGEHADTLRLDPLEPQQFPISMLQYHVGRLSQAGHIIPNKLFFVCNSPSVFRLLSIVLPFAKMRTGVSRKCESAKGRMEWAFAM